VVIERNSTFTIACDGGLTESVIVRIAPFWKED